MIEQTTSSLELAAWYSIGMSVAGYFHKNVPEVVNRQVRDAQREEMVRQGFTSAEVERRLAGYSSPYYMDPVLQSHCQVVERLGPGNRKQVG
jgi:hypothetical protein